QLRKLFAQMGSLMAGWDSPVLDPKLVKFQRNWSLTKGEIKAYWKSKKETEEEHLRDIYGSPNSTEAEVQISFTSPQVLFYFTFLFSKLVLVFDMTGEDIHGYKAPEIKFITKRKIHGHGRGIEFGEVHRHKK
ncbi:hypothetical protein RJ641_029007, partial [Dillenia turbinata]